MNNQRKESIIKNFTIKELDTQIKGDYIKLDTPYQRSAKVWNTKIKVALINSIFDGTYIPPILIANYGVIDGKQRLTAIIDFLNNKFKFNCDDNSSLKEINNLYFQDLPSEYKRDFLNSNLLIADLGELDDANILNMFIKLNKNTIKLNKVEILLAQIPIENKKMILDVSGMNELSELTNRKKNNDRFTLAGLIMRCITIINNFSNSRSSVRHLINKFFTSEIKDLDDLKEKCKSTIILMRDLFGSDSISLKQFNVLFESLFVFFYWNLESKNSFLQHKEEIKDFAKNEYNEYAKENQMGGGQKFDGMKYIKERIDFVEKNLTKYLTDDKRFLSEREKYEIWAKSNKKCAMCNKDLSNFSEATFDHIFPYTKGGKTNEENTQILCKSCNSKKKDKIV